MDGDEAVGGGPAPEDVLREWARILRWTERHAHGAFAALDGPGDPAAVDAAERRMGVTFPPDLRAWLEASRLGRYRTDTGRNACVAFGHDGILSDGGLLLELTDIERVHGSRTAFQESVPPEDEEVHWQPWWVPIAADRDGFYGRFLDTRTGAVGDWSEAEFPGTGRYPSLYAYLHRAANDLEGIPTAVIGPSVPGGQGPQDEAVRAWAAANGWAVNLRGRIPAAVREAWEAARADD